MATPYFVDITYVTERGEQGNMHLTSSDVATALYLDPSGSGDLILSGVRSKIIRMLYSTTPATTTTAQVYINGANTGQVLTGACNLATSVSPQISVGTPIYVPAGGKIRFVQV